LKNRRRLLLDKISQYEFDALLVTNIANVRYLTGFTGSSGACLLSDKESMFFTDGRYKIQAAREVEGWEVFDMPNKLKETIEQKNYASVGVEGGSMTCLRYEELKKQYPSMCFVVTDNLVESLRVIKDISELSTIQYAIDIAQKAYRNWVCNVKPGASEKKLALCLEMGMQEGGGEDLSFKAIVASGLRSAMPHAKPSSKTIEEGDMVVVDFGVKYNGYCSDTTRTLIVGEASALKKGIFNVVKCAQEEVFKHARPGMSCGDVDKLAREYIEKAGWGNYYIHGTGHGVGLDVHEAPTVGKRQERLIEVGMVFTVEPGIYHPETGGVRIEDMVVMREGGVEILTSLSRDFACCV